jgi:hypothetical protein
MPLFLLPLLIVFVALFPFRDRRAVLTVSGLGVACLLVGILEYHRHKLLVWLTPYSKNYLSARGLVDVPLFVGSRPVVMHTGVRIVLTALTFAAAISCFAFLSDQRKRGTRNVAANAALSWSSLATLLLPFSAAYLLFLVPRSAYGGMLDRYLPPIFAVCILLLTRCFQELVPARLAPRLGSVVFATIAFLAIFDVAAMHDLFAMYRANLAAVAEPLAAGVPRSQIGGGFEYDDWTEIEMTGYVNEPRIENPPGAYHAPVVERGTQPCNNEKADMVPHVVPRYILSFDPDACAGPSEFAPVVYRNWLTGQPTRVYILRALGK